MQPQSNLHIVEEEDFETKSLDNIGQNDDTLTISIDAGMDDPYLNAGAETPPDKKRNIVALVASEDPSKLI